MLNLEQKFKVKVVQDFDGLNSYGAHISGSLTLKFGKIITVTKKEDTTWWRGEDEHGYEGKFPKTHVEKILDEKGK